MSTQISTSTVQTMSTKEISQLTEKRHAHVLRDTKQMLQDLDLINNPDLGYQQYQVFNDDKGRTAEIILNKELTLTLVSGYNVKLRYAVVKRLEQLEQQIKIIRVIPPQLLRWQEHQSSVIPNHFILMEIVTFELTLKLANEGLDIFKKLMPESSLAYGFNKFLAAQGEDVTSFPNHPVYTNWGKQVPERCYPVRLREIAYNYFWEFWMPEKAPKYLKERQPEVLPVIHVAITDLDKRLNTLRLPAPQGRLF